ncbi:ATP-dependent zinc metalloprotease FtsH [Sneathiella sp. P13V-1]|uniref:ATP-dependent zinc metalloprotease FtsH n=1 Tax=Sneathiella sp. P13V-1 TaxID=2697366 RepID=UPI00187BB7DC|nr:ATP-dependent zinc metalloprotease FtsH [Sneathiella sp. P13V-1]MBE7637367.1 ATP-dependent zinc metalloprotease FtsH [Sneathiella sp. P13V-1]
MKLQPIWVWYFVVGLVLFGFLALTRLEGEAPFQKVSYTEFKQLVELGDVETVTLKGELIDATLKAARQFPSRQEPVRNVQSGLPSSGDEDLIPLLEKKNVQIWNEPAPEGNNWLWSFLPWLLIIGVYFYMIRRMQSGMMDRFGDRGASDFLMGDAKREEKGAPKVKFDDVAGQDNAKREVAELVDFLKFPENYQKLGAEPPRGVLLMGPPGTGKTLLARALAGEAEVNFFYISASEFIEMFVGVGASRVRKMFEEAKKRAPAIIFIDELDAVGRVRGTGLGGGNDEREQTLNQILSEMDGFTGHEQVFVLAATNRPDVLDPALLRPGRFDRHVTLELPDKKARMAILKVHTKKKPLAKEVDLETVAAGCPGFSGADLKNLANEAAIAAAREGASEITLQHFDESRDKILLGTVRTLAIQEDERHRLAIHEAGHTTAAYYLPNADPIYKVTIIPRGRSLGGTHMLPEEDRYTQSEDYLKDQMAVMLAGRAAEQVFLGNVSSGADDDIKRATKIARAMVSQWGMSDEIGPVDLRISESHPFLGREITQPKHYSEEMAGRIDSEVSKLLQEAEGKAISILKDHKPRIEQLVSLLEKEETIGREEIIEVLDEK